MGFWLKGVQVQETPEGMEIINNSSQRVQVTSEGKDAFSLSSGEKNQLALENGKEAHLAFHHYDPATPSTLCDATVAVIQCHDKGLRMIDIISHSL